MGPVSKIEKIIFAHLFKKYYPICYSVYDRDKAARCVLKQKNEGRLRQRENYTETPPFLFR